MQLLLINGIDFTKYINDSTYKVSSQSVYEEWIDANYKIHRSEYRKRVAGSFEMVFVKDEDYNRFINNIKGSNLITMTVYVGGSVNKLVESKFYYTIDTDSHRQINTTYMFNKLKITIEEQ